jgi:hypothetical protein
MLTTIAPIIPARNVTGNIKNTRIYVTGSLGKRLNNNRLCTYKPTGQPSAEAPVKMKKNLSHLLMVVLEADIRSKKPTTPRGSTKDKNSPSKWKSVWIGETANMNSAARRQSSSQHRFRKIGALRNNIDCLYLNS